MNVNRNSYLVTHSNRHWLFLWPGISWISFGQHFLPSFFLYGFWFYGANSSPAPLDTYDSSQSQFAIPFAKVRDSHVIQFSTKINKENKNEALCLNDFHRVSLSFYGLDPRTFEPESSRVPTWREKKEMERSQNLMISFGLLDQSYSEGYT